jgi:hypothetical protein
LLAILVLFIVLATVYNMTLPLFEAPDEMDHFRYIEWLATGQGLPHIPADLPTVGHEIWQPPLYYAMMAPMVAMIDTQDLHQIAPLNPYWRQGAGINVHYHSMAESFPYRSTALAVHLVRFATTLVACLTIIGTYGLARQIIPTQASLAAALVAFNPMFVAISAAVNNDTLVTALGSLTITTLIYLIGRSKTSLLPYGLVGLLWGLTTLAKLNGLAIGSLILAGLVFVAWKSRSWRPLALGAPLAGAAMLGVSGWWLFRNLQEYGDPLAWNAMRIANQGLLRTELLKLPDVLSYASHLKHTYWAIFGYGGLKPPLFFYDIVNGLTLLALVGLGAWWLRTGRVRLDSPKVFSVALLIGWFVITYVSLLQWMRQLLATDQGRLLFPAASSLAVLLTLGSSVISGKRGWIGRSIAVVLAVWATLSPFLVIRPAYARPAPLSSMDGVPNTTSVHFGDEIELLGYGLSQTDVAAGESLVVDLFWRALVPMSESYVIALHVFDAAGQDVSDVDTIPYDWRYATAVWPKGQPFQDTYRLPPIDNNAAPGTATLMLTVYPWSRPDQPLPYRVAGLEPGRHLPLTNIEIPSCETEGFNRTNGLGTIFGQQARLTDFDAPETAVAGQPFELILYWQALHPDGQDYSVFVHLLDDSGNLVAQGDSPPQGGTHPTSKWTPDEQVQDVHTILLPHDIRSGVYQVSLGLYSHSSGIRLPAYCADGTRWLDSSVSLTTVLIER